MPLERQDMIAYLEEDNISVDEIISSVDSEYLIDELSQSEIGIINDDISVDDLESIYSEIDLSTDIL